MKISRSSDIELLLHQILVPLVFNWNPLNSTSDSSIAFNSAACNKLNAILLQYNAAAMFFVHSICNAFDKMNLTFESMPSFGYFMPLAQWNLIFCIPYLIKSVKYNIIGSDIALVMYMWNATTRFDTAKVYEISEMNWILSKSYGKMERNLCDFSIHKSQS